MSKRTANVDRKTQYEIQLETELAKMTNVMDVIKLKLTHAKNIMGKEKVRIKISENECLKIIDEMHAIKSTLEDVIYRLNISVKVLQNHARNELFKMAKDLAFGQRQLKDSKILIKKQKKEIEQLKESLETERIEHKLQIKKIWMTSNNVIEQSFDKLKERALEDFRTGEKNADIVHEELREAYLPAKQFLLFNLI